MARVCGYTKVITMPVGSYIDAWLDILQESDMPTPFTAKQAYNWIVNAPPKKEGKRRRTHVPKSTNSLSKLLSLSPRVVVVGISGNINRADYISESGGRVRLYDFV